MTETKFRSFIKAISWRVIATCITFSIALALTGETVIALEIGFFDLILKLIAYFLHERVWGKINVGRKAHPLEDIKLKRALEVEDKELIKEKLRDLGYLDE
ncbi:MAG: DUF2061 domain-containing protein [Candidatus Aminicenantes bacterium]|nr:DUF2061 domain-containing protein [Candidatus Aminicenantes bacterium]